MSRLLISGIAMLALLACGATKGVVTAKHFAPAHSYWVQDYRTRCDTTTKYDKGRSTRSTDCHQVWVGQHQVYVADDWTLDLRNDQGDAGTVSVAHRIYDEARVGDLYDSQTNEVTHQ